MSRPRKNNSVGKWTPPSLIGEGQESKASSSDYKASRTKKVYNTTPSLSDKYDNINNCSNPFNFSETGAEAREAIRLCQLAYWGFSLLRNTIDVMTELSNSNIYLKGGNKASRDFTNKWLEKINIWSLKDKFFREFFRSGNVFYYRFDGIMTTEEISKMQQTYAKKKIKIPLKYILLNPALISVENTSNFIDANYYKVLNSYEIERLKFPKTEEDVKIFESLTPDEQKKIREGQDPMITLDKERLYAIFYKKQDYEPLACPMAFSVLDDINRKMELKKIDDQIMRTSDWSILLMTMGAEPDKGGINYDNIRHMQELLANQSVKRVLVADHTTKGEWLIPDIDKILGQEKYKQVNEDIQMGLNSILFTSGEKFANATIKVQVFVERLKEARQAFLNEFLLPEIKKLCKSVGYKDYPTVYFEEISLKDEAQFARIYTQLASIGMLTPEETLQALENGELPNAESSIESQKKFKSLRDSGLYEPLVGGNNKQEGRPTGSGTPQTTKKVKPIGTKGFSMSKLVENSKEFGLIKSKIEKKLKSKFKIKELDETQSNIAKILAQTIMVNEDKGSWDESIAKYVQTPVEISKEKSSEIEAIGSEFSTVFDDSVLLYLSKVD